MNREEWAAGLVIEVCCLTLRLQSPDNNKIPLMLLILEGDWSKSAAVRQSCRLCLGMVSVRCLELDSALWGIFSIPNIIKMMSMRITPSLSQPKASVLGWRSQSGREKGIRALFALMKLWGIMKFLTPDACDRAFSLWGWISINLFPGTPDAVRCLSDAVGHYAHDTAPFFAHETSHAAHALIRSGMELFARNEQVSGTCLAPSVRGKRTIFGDSSMLMTLASNGWEFRQPYCRNLHQPSQGGALLLSWQFAAESRGLDVIFIVSFALANKPHSWMQKLRVEADLLGNTPWQAFEYLALHSLAVNISLLSQINPTCPHLQPRPNIGLKIVWECSNL